jgi:hypothetical protein
MKPLPLSAPFLTAVVLGIASCAHQVTDRTLNSSPSRANGTSAAGSSTFTQGESKRCETLTGAEKARCDREEATKTEGTQADTATQK